MTAPTTTNPWSDPRNGEQVGKVYQWALTVSRLLLVPEEDRADICQEVMASLMTRGVNPTEIQGVGFFVTAATRTWVSTLRKRSAKRRTMPPEAHESQCSPDCDTTTLCHQLVDRFTGPREWIAVVVDKQMHGFTWDEIAEKYGISVDAARCRYDAAMKELRTLAGLSIALAFICGSALWLSYPGMPPAPARPGPAAQTVDQPVALPAPVSPAAAAPANQGGGDSGAVRPGKTSGLASRPPARHPTSVGGDVVRLSLSSTPVSDEVDGIVTPSGIAHRFDDSDLVATAD